MAIKSKSVFLQQHIHILVLCVAYSVIVSKIRAEVIDNLLIVQARQNQKHSVNKSK